MRRLVPAALAVVALALAVGSAGAAERSSLTGKVWVLSSFGGKKPVAGSHVSIEFARGGRVEGSAGCNSYGGAYTASRVRLTMSSLISTQMACVDQAVMTQEAAYLEALSAVRLYDVRDGKLTLRNAAGRSLAVFAAQSQALAGTAWIVLAYYNGKQAVVSVLTGTKLTAAFGKDGMVTGSGGCNHYDATYKASAPKLAVGPVAATRKSCPSPAGVMAQESAYLAALGTAASYKIDGSTLELFTAKGTSAVTLKRA